MLHSVGHDIPLAITRIAYDKFLAAALGGNADYLIAGDEDLLVLDGDPKLGKLRVLTPRASLEILDRQDG